VSRARICSPKPTLFRFLPATNTIQHRQFSSNVEKHEFQAETKSLLDIVAKSLYSEQEVIDF
jgi:TNF receptor-associated protein 1